MLNCVRVDIFDLEIKQIHHANRQVAFPDRCRYAVNYITRILYLSMSGMRQIPTCGVWWSFVQVSYYSWLVNAHWQFNLAV